MYRNTISKTFSIWAQIIVFSLLLMNSNRLLADGGGNGLGDEVSITPIVTYGNGGSGIGNITQISLPRYTDYLVSEIRVVATLSEAAMDGLQFGVQLSEKLQWSESVTSTCTVDGKEVSLVIEIPESIQLRSGELLTLSAYQLDPANPVAVKFAAMDGIVITVNIDAFKEAQPYPMEIKDMNGRTIATYDANSDDGFKSVFQNLSRGLYMRLDPTGVKDTEKFVKY